MAKTLTSYNILKALTDSNIKISLLTASIIIGIFGIIYPQTIDCNQANPEHPKHCEDGKWFLSLMLIAIPVTLLMGTVLTLNNKNVEASG